MHCEQAESLYIFFENLQFLIFSIQFNLIMT